MADGILKKTLSKLSMFIQHVYLLQQSKVENCQPEEIKMLFAKGWFFFLENVVIILRNTEKC